MLLFLYLNTTYIYIYMYNKHVGAVSGSRNHPRPGSNTQIASVWKEVATQATGWQSSGSGGKNGAGRALLFGACPTTITITTK